MLKRIYLLLRNICKEYAELFLANVIRRSLTEQSNTQEEEKPVDFNHSVTFIDVCLVTDINIAVYEPAAVMKFWDTQYSQNCTCSVQFFLQTAHPPCNFGVFPCFSLSNLYMPSLITKNIMLGLNRQLFLFII